MPKVICQQWEETERGWGTRPDGYSMHLTEEDRAAFVKAYYAEFNNEDKAPDCYTRTSGEPFEMEIDESTHSDLLARRIRGQVGIWGDGNVPPLGQGSRTAGGVSLQKGP